MSVTVGSFVARFPEFANTDTGLVQACINEAARQAGPSLGTQQDDACGYMAAHLLACSPSGEQARLKTTDGKVATTYLDQYNRIARQRSFFGPRVI